METAHVYTLGQSDYHTLLKQIFEHEREYRGVHWPEEFFDAHGKAKDGFVNQVLDQTFRKIANTKGPFQINAAVQYAPDDAKLLDLIGFNKDVFQSLSQLRGNELKVYLLELLHNLQQVEKELNSGSVNWELVSKCFAAVGVVATGVKACGTISAMVTQGATYIAGLAAVYGVAVTVAALAAIVVVLVSFVILMLKEAREYHLVLNHTDYNLRIYEIFREHGKVEFLPKDDTLDPVISSRSFSGKKPVFFGGLFGLRKRDGALIGAEGVIQLDMYHPNGSKHQTCTFLAYDVPLTGIFGGDNSCFVKCTVGNPSAEEFFKKYKKNIEAGNTESSDSSGNIRITKRINSKGGSEVFAISTYEQK